MGKSTSTASSWKQRSTLVLSIIFCTSNSTLDSSLFLCSCPNTVKMVTFGVKEPRFLIGSFSFLADCFYSLILTLPHSLVFVFFFHSRICTRPICWTFPFNSAFFLNSHIFSLFISLFCLLVIFSSLDCSSLIFSLVLLILLFNSPTDYLFLMTAIFISRQTHSRNLPFLLYHFLWIHLFVWIQFLFYGISHPEYTLSGSFFYQILEIVMSLGC